MKLICTMACRNEDWCLGLTARAVLMWCDGVVFLDHWCEDKSHDIMWQVFNEHGSKRVRIREWRSRTWEEMAMRQHMLEEGRAMGATHIVYVDADEILTGNLLPRIRNLVECTQPGLILQIPWINLRDSIKRYHSNGTWAEQDASVAFRDDPRYHWAARDGYDFHQRHPMGLPFASYKPIRRHQGGLMHLQMVNDRRLKAKQYLYQLTERLRWPGREPVEVVRKRYSLAVYGCENEPASTPLERARRIQQGDPPLSFAATPADWWAAYEPWMEHLHVDREPWQLAACAEILREHPGIQEGLDNFGLEL